MQASNVVKLFRDQADPVQGRVDRAVALLKMAQTIDDLLSNIRTEFGDMAQAATAVDVPQSFLDTSTSVRALLTECLAEIRATR